jgi:TetR/AcrR family transcriptional repressor of bet genes
MSRRPNSELRRAEIVSALLAVMSRYGYEKATIQLIAQEAGLAPGLLHYHFKTKAEIFLELVKTMVDGAQRRYDALATSAQTPKQCLHAYITARLGLGDGADTSAVAAWVVIGAEAVRQPEVRQVYQQAAQAELALIEQLLSACLKQRGKQLKSVTHLAASLLAYMEGAFQLASAAPDIMPSGYAADMALQLVLRYIDAEPDMPARARP